jgi:LCP family protein required for cell wall assembly
MFVDESQVSLSRAGRPAIRADIRAIRVLRRAVVALLAVLALTATGVAYWQTHGLLGAITISRALGIDTPRSTGGGTNILLIGLDSRKDQDGNDLPQNILDKLHAGDSSSGGYNTNTLILVHIGPDDRVVAFSIPRDDYVAVDGITGFDHIKIKEAYGLTKAQTERELQDEGVTDPVELEQRGREAGRGATLRAVHSLTGQPIDYFAEVNLAGFYDLTESLGGVEVCLNHAVYDEYSGADFPAGLQTLDAAQALAFVRQRHGLENGDLDRTHRQQAFLLSIAHQLQSAGVLGNLDEFRGLIEVARKDVVLSEGWGEAQFRRMAALAGGDVEFRTLPVVRYAVIEGQDVNIIDPATIRAEISAAIDGTAATPTTDPDSPGSVIAVVNAGDTYGLASRAADILTRQGYTVVEIRDRNDGEPAETGVGYGAGAAAEAEALTSLLGIDAAPQADPTLAAGHIRVLLGADYQILSATESSEAPMPTEDSGADASALPIPDAGGPVASGGIPCVN